MGMIGLGLGIGALAVGVWLLVWLGALLIHMVLTVAVLRKAGLSGWWSLLLLVPLGFIAGIWVLAYARWPAVDDPGAPGLPPQDSGSK